MRTTIEQYKVGHFYKVPILPIGKPFLKPDGTTLTLSNWEGFTGDLPLLHPYTEDEDFDHPHLIGSPKEKLLSHHGHPDWRFISEHWFLYFVDRWGREGIMGRTIMLPWPEHVLHIPHATRSMVCRRSYEQAMRVPDYTLAGHTRSLEKKYRCAALQNGKCPHRGTLQKAMIQQGDNLVCPAHGLRWNRKSGALVPRMTT